MMTAASVRMFARYNAWADKVMFDAVAKLPPGEDVKPRTSLFKNIVHTLNHNYVIDQIWRGHLEGRDHGYTARNTPDSPPLADLWKAQQEIDGWYVAWSDRVTGTELEEEVRFTFVGGDDGCMTRGEILQHIVNHTSYHRGFVAQMICEVPARPPTTDLPVFLRDVPQIA